MFLLSDEIQSKVVQLQNFSQLDISTLDISTQLRLWKETFIFRRQVLRDQSTSDIMKNFPAYSDAFLVFEEVKMLVNIDLSKEVRRQVSILLNKLVETPAFIADATITTRTCHHLVVVLNFKQERNENGNKILNEEEQNDTLMNNASQENVESSQSRLPLASMTNSTVALRQSKRTRRT
ncbi:unnamed protein product [Didymodactylos carnosus]|uniref:Uncharacterized protein n=1 Tax=Didymodactylos carnosus TaxID=1234261 RepID=A0A815BUS4_9BILA|nr:unnamed protein product [Didymodactylos carnosus]CAF4068716.1 unnamed protein product [Didymodactylos carnosus]